MEWNGARGFGSCGGKGIIVGWRDGNSKKRFECARGVFLLRRGRTASVPVPVPVPVAFGCASDCYWTS